ncbi:PREDICTED: translationally-controlled tumor protein homolog [Amphimedon queenslandica]|uniref:Translationally-controlled tumor protein homolog n=1 Tax=Amphimedon queenslandica TaxID=400682 RepID=A0A1X7VVC0_AMPQE|nr:PREDICTED: translationally-controlled tumor protein homolog [Amphimedon queenslandica]|eukprot:XP_003382650.1 PREDICTED: translationally-controlled tumor protein homolog [Amphimedon queenslandica]
MIIYKDLFTGAELFSDTYKMKVVDDIFYEVEGKMTTESGGGIDDALIGGNASAEDGAEELEETSVSGCNIVLANKLEETSFSSKKDYQLAVKGYLKKLSERLQEKDPERAAAFKAAAQPAMKKIFENYKDFQFFHGEGDYETAGMVALLNFREDGLTPYMLFFKDGVIEEKV